MPATTGFMQSYKRQSPGRQRKISYYDRIQASILLNIYKNLNIYIYIYIYPPMHINIFFRYAEGFRSSPKFNISGVMCLIEPLVAYGYRRKRSRLNKFKSWLRQCAFPITLISFEKVQLQLISLQLLEIVVHSRLFNLGMLTGLDKVNFKPDLERNELPQAISAENTFMWAAPNDQTKLTHWIIFRL